MLPCDIITQRKTPESASQKSSTKNFTLVGSSHLKNNSFLACYLLKLKYEVKFRQDIFYG